MTTSRKIAAERTRADLISAARILWTSPDEYDAHGIRDVAKRAGYTTGALYAQFPGKAALYKAAFGRPAPDECPITKAAHDMFRVLQNLIENRPEAIGPVPPHIERDWLEAEALVDGIKDQLLDCTAQVSATGADGAIAA